MPVFVENPVRFSKKSVKSELVNPGVDLALAERENQAYLQVYMQHVANKTTLDFSSDEEEQGQNAHEEERRGEDSDMVDLSALTDNQLKHKLLLCGVKAGPIVASTRALYEKKLYRLMTQHLQNSVGSKDDAGKYSDSEDEKSEEEESGSDLLVPESVSLTDQSLNPSTESVTDVLMEMFPDTAMTPTGITATKRRSIKGAAGRPVQFKYPETPLSPTTLGRREIQQRLVPLWVQILVFLVVVALLHVIYMSMNEPLENPFSTLLSSLNQEPSSDDLALVPNSQDTHT